MWSEDETRLFKQLEEYDKEVELHNITLIESLNASEDYKLLIEYCQVRDKIEIVDNPKGRFQDENVGIFKNIHVDQRASIGCFDGDSFEGNIYAMVEGVWYSIPFST